MWLPEENVMAAQSWNQRQLEWLVGDIKKRQNAIEYCDPMGKEASGLLDSFVSGISDFLKRYELL